MVPGCGLSLWLGSGGSGRGGGIDRRDGVLEIISVLLFGFLLSLSFVLLAGFLLLCIGSISRLPLHLGGDDGGWY